MRSYKLQVTFRGELVPQNPGDATASVLLARIQGKQEILVVDGIR